MKSLFLSLAAVLLVACSSNESNDTLARDSGNDLGNDVGTDADANDDRCCPISDKPACCMQFGGKKTDGGTCAAACDNLPGPENPAWEKRTDDAGCPYWYTPPGTPLACNPGPLDSGSDALDAEDAPDAPSD